MILNSPTISGSLTVTGNIIASGSITLSGSVASASYADTASFVALAQSASNAVSAQTASFANAFTVAGNLTAQTLVVQTITSSVDFVTGSTRFGSLASNTHQFTGSMYVTGAFYIATGSVGIGTVSPSQLFEVVGGEIKAGRVDSSNEGGQLSFGRSTDNATAWYIDAYGNTASPQLRFVNVSNAVVAMTITGSNVGIGNTSPIALLDIYTGSIGTYFRGGSDNVARQLKISSATTTNAGDTHIIDAQSGTGVLQLSTTSIPRIYIPSNGSSATLGSGGIAKIIGTGTISGYTELQFYTYNGPTNQPPVSIGIIKTDNGGYENGEFYIATKSSNANNAPTERVRVTSGGYFKASNGGYLNNTSNYHELRSTTTDDWTAVISHGAASPYGILVKYNTASPNNSSNSFLVCSDLSANKCIIYSNGNVVNVNNSYGTLSDIKLKENIVDATSKLDHIMQLKVRNFNLIADETKTKQIGFIAQEFEQIFPGLIEEAPDKDMENNDLGTVTKTIKTSVLVPMLVKAIQELKTQNDALQSRIETLESK
jgi:hypothetical protein